MIPLGGDSWTIGTQTDPNVNFCLWVLLRDGMRVSPFDVHSEGDGALRAAGLTADNWLAWLHDCVRAATSRNEADRVDPGGVENADSPNLADLFYESEPPTPADIERVRRAYIVGTAPDRWRRPDEVRAVLLGLWPRYIKEQRQTSERDFEQHIERLQNMTPVKATELVERNKREWKEIQQFRPLPPLHFYQVDYPSPVVEVVPPASAVIGLLDDEDSPSHHSLVLEAARRLKESRERGSAPGDQ